MRVLGLLATASLLVCGCSEDTRAPAAPLDRPDGAFVMGRPIGGPPLGSDAGADASSTTSDAGTTLPSGCIEVPEGDSQNRLALSQSGESIEFETSRAYVVWEPSCAPARLVLGLTEGACSFGEGRRLVFGIDRDQIGTNIFLGLNVVPTRPFDDGIRVRYVVPAGLGADEDFSWGNCEGATGTLTLLSAGTIAGERIAGEFDLTLTDCGPTAVELPVDVRGAFDVTIADDFDTICGP